MRLSGITPESIVDGPGLRLVVFAQGCTHQCPNCHNPETWDLKGGKELTIREVIRLIKRHRKNKQGITFSGGEPFLQAAEFAELALGAQQMGWDLVTYTGFRYEELAASDSHGIKALLSATDILIDGKYIHELRDRNLRFCGSSNQRLIDMKATQQTGQLRLWRPV